jgi:hypothetical protein
MGKIFLITGQKKKTGRKNIERQGTFLSTGKKAGDAIPIGYFYIHIIDSLFKQEVITTDEEFVLQRLFGIRHFWPGMLDKILHLCGKSDFHTQNPLKNLLGRIGKPIGNFMGENQ